VLGGFVGAAPAEGLRDASAVARALTMLGVAGEWARLLLWPARLQGDYAPWEIAPWSQWSAEQTAGLLVVGATTLALALAWRRAPVVAFAIGWVVVALAPVSNLVVPTGILLAERTLLLPSIGVVLAVAAAVPAAAWHSARWRPALYGGVTALGLLGLVRSRARVPVFRDRDAYLSSLMRDAPRSWRTMVAAGIAATEAGDPVTGRRLLLAANATWPDSPRPLAVLAFYDRLQGRCDAAIAPQWQALRLAPEDRWTRLPLVACLLDVGAYAEAGRLAAADTGSDPMGRALAAAAATADSAARAGAPPHSVRLAPVTGGLTLVGTRR
jgi:hypothetical protein